MADQPEVLVNLPPASQGGVLALDLAGVTGWAYCSPQDRKAVFGSFDLPDPQQKGRVAMNGAAYTAISDLHAVYRPSKVVNEKALPVAVKKFDPRTKTMRISPIITNDDAVSQLRGLIGVSEVVSAHYRRPQYEYAKSTYFNAVMHGFPVIWKKGKANGEEKRDVKAMAMRWARAHGYPVEDDNQADALILLEYFLRMHEGGGYV